MTSSLTLAQARALWWHKQALSGASRKPIAALIGESGWLRTLGGADAYLAARARRPGMKRASSTPRSAPASCACTPRCAAASTSSPRRWSPISWPSTPRPGAPRPRRSWARFGKTLKVVEALAPRVLAALTEPMTTDAVRKAVGDIPSFGDAGKKVGLSSPLPLALRDLELAGKIERTLEGGRLDTDRYLWRKTRASSARPRRTTSRASPASSMPSSASPGRPHARAAVGVVGAPAARPQDRARQRRCRRRHRRGRRGGLPAPRRSCRSSRPQAARHRAGRPRGQLPQQPRRRRRHRPQEPRLRGRPVWRQRQAGAARQGAAPRCPRLDRRRRFSLAGFWEVDPRTSGAIWHTFEPAARRSPASSTS